MTRSRLLAGCIAPLVGALALAGCTPAAAHSPTTSLSRGAHSSATTTAPTAAAAPAGSAPAHVVVVLEENHSAADVAHSTDAPYLHWLASHGASLTHFFAVTHPSEPNYLALFSGSTHGLTDDSCPHSYPGPDLAGQLRAAGRTFVGYAEGLPAVGSQTCSSGEYARKHAPWTDFTDVPRSASRPMSEFPADYAALPSLSFVIPDLQHDMHDGSVAAADSWLRGHLGGYVRWASAHDSVLVVTWDEDDHTEGNRVPALVVGAGVRDGSYSGHTDLYGLLRTIEWWFGLPALGAARSRVPITALRPG